ncbi:MAG: polysaccharide biosynthesis/export family protein [Candidatus Eremiobacteraeota bacterium]|nr:polysaccharide biosynthesis/export family protein [Candidatus Eremiobacteraeota bacterium]
MAALLAEAAFAAAPGRAAAVVADDYKIRSGDILTVTVFGEPSLTQPLLKVLPGGAVVEPLVGQVNVGGLSPTQAGTAIAAALKHYLRHPQVTVSVSELGPVDVYVLGNVKLPGKYLVDPQSRLMDAIAAAGGLGPVDGDYPEARIAMVGGDPKSVSLQQLFKGGDLSLNLPVTPGTTIYVPSPITFNVQVLGAVDHAGDVTLHEGDGIVVAVARAGNSPNSLADLNHVTVRHNDDGKVTTQTVNVYDILKTGDTSKDVPLHKGDTVYVPQGTGRRDGLTPITSVLFALGRLI